MSSPSSPPPDGSPTSSAHAPASWQQSISLYAPYIAGASVLISVVARRYAAATRHLAEEIVNAERIRPASLHGAHTSAYGKFEGRLFAAKPEHIVVPERASTIEALQVYSKTYEVRNEYRKKVTTNKGKTTTRTETVKVESLVSERTQGHKWLSVRDDTASVGVVQISVEGDQKDLSRLRRKVVNDFEPIAANTNPSLHGAADGTLMSLAKSALVAAIQSQAQGPHILGYRYIQEVIETDKPLFLLGEFKPLPGCDAVEFQLSNSPQYRDRGHVLVAGTEDDTLNEAASSASMATYVSHFCAAFGLALGSYHAFEYFQQHRGNGASY